MQFILLSVNFPQGDQIDGAISLSSVSGRLCPRPFLGGGAIFLVERNSCIMQSQSSQEWPSLQSLFTEICYFSRLTSKLLPLQCLS